jgi:lysophospholipase L1-like esterase
MERQQERRGPIQPQLADSYDPGRAEPQGRLRRLCRDLDALWIDLLGPFRAHRDRELFFDGIHLTRHGHELAAREIARRLTEGDAGTGQGSS